MHFYCTFGFGMKFNKPTYFSLFFLFCFLASFSSVALRNINSVSSKSNIKSNNTLTISSKEESNSSTNDFLFEENENEFENDFHIQVSILPFFISFYQYEVSPPYIISATPLAGKLSNPIYIAICKFRI